ncbi:MAG: hypothetical protein ACFFHV_18485 [Promethearchaeota archaeon]
MEAYDFDEEIQKVFNKSFSDIQSIDWKDWLNITSKNEFEDLALKLSGLDKVDDLLNRIKEEKTDSRSFSVNLETYIENYQGIDPLIMVHTSGTTDSSLVGIKWFHMTKSLIEKLWIPGMRAIFESSGLNSEGSAVIFVPSRLKLDGINEFDYGKYISLYSSEFSQRIMLSAIKPNSYLLYEYKNSNNLEIISEILSLENLTVVSAPAATILGWANLEKFRQGLKNSLDALNKNENLIIEKFITMINNEGFNAASIKIQKELSKKVSKATVIFSISSLNSNQWESIRTFMKWEKGREKFTNLYVGSELGPFASSLGDYALARSNKMYIFPLTLPVLEYKGNYSLITQAKEKFGKLLISRHNTSYPLINIDTGDVIVIKNQEGIPIIGGEIFRSGFRLKYPINISKKIKLSKDVNIYAGDFFSLKNFDVIAPRYLLDCLNNGCNIQADSLLLLGFENNDVPWELYLPYSEDIKCDTDGKIRKTIYNCPKVEEIEKALQNNYLTIELINEQPIDFKAARLEILRKVQKGSIPKGILKKWALYLILPTSISEEKIL